MKKLLSLILGLVLCFSLLPTTVSASELGPDHTHMYDQEVVDDLYLVAPATCTTAATYAKSCLCGEASSEDTFSDGDPLGHNLGDWTPLNASQHQRKCGRCGTTEKADHTFQNNKCTVCGYEKEPEPPQTGTISITKSITGDLSDDAAAGKISFSVDSQDGSYQKSLSLSSDFTYDSGRDQWSKRLEVPAGAYTITETASHVDGYTETVTISAGSGSSTESKSADFTVTAGESIGIIITDAYVKDSTDVTVTFDMNGHGTAVKAQTIAKGTKATKPEDPTEKGWKFEGWYQEKTLTTAFDFTKAVDADTVVYAKWTEVPVTYTVTFKMNGHGKQVEAQKVESGNKAKKPANPTESGYVFQGWYKDAKFAAKFNFETEIKEDTTVYAKWAKDTSDSSAAKTGDNNHLSLWLTLAGLSGFVVIGASLLRRRVR